MKKLYYVRHGLTEMNAAGVLSGHIETPLTDEGRTQARKAGLELKQQNVKLDLIIASPLSRTRETAEIIANEIGYPIKQIEINPLFIERHFGELEGTPWKPDLNFDGIANVETTETIIHRASRAVTYLESLQEDNVLVVAHSSIGRALRHVLTDGEIPFGDLTRRLQNGHVHRWR